MGSLSLLQGIVPTQGSNPGLPHCRWILYQLSHQGSPYQMTTPIGSFPGGATGKEPACQCRRHEMWIWSLGQEHPLEKEMATHASILAWKISWTEESAGLQSIALQSEIWLKWLSTHALLLVLKPFFFFFLLHSLWYLCSPTRIKPKLQQKCRILTTRPPGNSQAIFITNSISFVNWQKMRNEFSLVK